MKKYSFVISITVSFVLGFFVYPIIDNYFPQILHQKYTYNGEKIFDAIGSYKNNILNNKAVIGRIAVSKLYIPINFPIIVCEYVCYDGSTLFVKIFYIDKSTTNVVRISESQFNEFYNSADQTSPMTIHGDLFLFQ